jgi:hypothetical protein
VRPLTLGGNLNDIIPCDNRASCQIFPAQRHTTACGHAWVRRSSVAVSQRRSAVCPYCDFHQGRTKIHDEKAVSKSIA